MAVKKKQKEKQMVSSFIKDEIILLCTLAVCIVLLIGNFGFGGFVGKGLSRIIFGIFGIFAYVVPVFLFLGVIYYICNKRKQTVFLKVASVFILLCSICLFLQLLYAGKNTMKIIEACKVGALYHKGGGFLGGTLAAIMCPAFGLMGTYIINIVICIITFIILTERSFFASVRQGGKRVYQTAKKSEKRRQNYSQKKREEYRQKKQMQFDREEAKVSKNRKVSFEIPVLREVAEKQEVVPEFTPEVMERLFKEKTQERQPQGIPKKERRKPRQSVEDVQKEIHEIADEIQEQGEGGTDTYVFPSLDLLTKGEVSKGDTKKHLQETALKLQQTLKNFGVNVTITDVSCGPSVTRYEMQPETGVKVSKIVNLADDIKLNLAAADIRIEAPIPGKAAIGIEVPNKENVMVRFRELVETAEFRNHKSKICITVGKDISGQVIVADIAKMPHLLIAGATGSGKSVCINTIIMSLLYRASPDEVKLILIDPKVVELSMYNGIPHLFIPVVTDPKKAAGALNWAVAEMMERYEKFKKYQVRDLAHYNRKVEELKDVQEEDQPVKMPQIVIIVDELADLMMVASSDVESAICRLAQLARAAGIHLILATQRPSVDVITGLIKANMPSRIAFSVSSGVDSRTILDMVGAEKLLGNGDMLFYPQGYQKPLRVQGPFVSDKEVEAVVEFLKSQNSVVYNTEIEEKMSSTTLKGAGTGKEKDEYFADAGKFIIEKEKGSIGMLQRWLKIGFNRAARIMEQLEAAGVVGPEEGTKPRKVLMSMEEFELYLQKDT